MLIRATVVEVCDARDEDSSTKAGNKKIINGELAERYRTGLLSQGWDNTQVSSILTLSSMFADK